MTNIRKRILHIVWSFNNGGIETMLVNIANHQCKNNDVAIMIVNSSYDQALLSTLSENVRVISINRPEASKNPLYYAKLNIQYRKFAPNIVHFHQLSLTKILVKRKSDNWFFTQHCIPVNFAPNKHITKYIAISQCVKKGIHKISPIDNCVVCYNGVDFARISEKEVWNDSTHHFKIVAAARIDTKIKGQDTIIEAIHLLPKEIKEKCTVDIYGDGPDKNLLELMIKKYGLEKNVHLKGNISNRQLLSLLKDYDMSIHASRIEGFGLAAVESIGSGLPVILSDVPGHNEICKEKITFAPDDAQDLAHKIEYCIEKYHEMKELASINKEFVKSKFTIENMVGNLDIIYNDL